MQYRREFRPPRDGEIAAFLSRFCDKIKEYGSEISFRPCPKCGGNNAQNAPAKVNKKTGFWRCWRCNETGGWYSLTKAFGWPLTDDDIYLPQANLPTTPSWLTQKLSSETRRPITKGHYPELLEYCHRRGIDNDTLNMWRVSSFGDKALRWPIYDWQYDKWAVANTKIKSCLGEFKTKDWFGVSGGATGLLIGNHLIDYNGAKRAIITEGQFDAMSGWAVGVRNIFSLPNGGNHINIGSMLRYIPDDWEIWLCVDMDSVGDMCVEQFFCKLGTNNVRRCKLPHKDLNEWLQAEPFLSVADIEKTVDNSKQFFFATIKNGVSQQKFLTIDMSISHERKDQIIAKWPWPWLNKNTGGGLFGGQTTGILAASGCGKTSFVNHLAVDIASNGTKVGLISLEGTEDEVLSNLKATIKNYSTDYPRTSDNIILSSLRGCKVDLDDCLAHIEDMLDSGAKIIIFDNLDFLTRDSNDKKIQIYARLVTMTVERGCHLIMAWQPHKVDHKKTVNSGDQKGYSQVYQDSHNYFVLNRTDKHVTLTIDKNREIGTRGKTLLMHYDIDKRIFRPAALSREGTENVGKLAELW